MRPPNKLLKGSPAHLMVFILLVSLTLPTAQASNLGLGRLFFTPEQRTQFDHPPAPKASADSGRESVLTVLTVNGIVQKHSGARTVWINGVAQAAGNSDERSPEALPVTVPGKSQPVKVKVGEKLLLEQAIKQTLPAPDK